MHLLTASPLAKGLFHRAIAESGSGIRRSPSRSLQQAEQDGVKFAESKGAKSIAELRAKPWQELDSASRFNVVVDGWFLPMDVEENIAAGKQNDVPMITGMSADEGSSAAGYGAVPADTWTKQVRDRYGDLAGR